MKNKDQQVVVLHLIELNVSYDQEVMKHLRNIVIGLLFRSVRAHVIYHE
jgi:hypothetical protein